MSLKVESSLRSNIARIAGILASDRFSTGDRAALRRMSPGQPLPLAFHGFASRYLPEGWQYAREDWTTIVAGMALMSPNIHNPTMGFGTALGEASYSEARLERLLMAEGRTRQILFLRAVRFLSSKSKPCDWHEGARLLLTRDGDKLESLNFHIARDFYRQIDKE